MHRCSVIVALFTLGACGEVQGLAGTDQPTAYRLSSAAMFEVADYYVIRFPDEFVERPRLVYIQASHLDERRVRCERLTRTCRAFIRPELTLFAIPVTDQHLREGMGTDICPHLEIIRNAVLLHAFVERPHLSFCAYRLEEPPRNHRQVGQRLGRR